MTVRALLLALLAIATPTSVSACRWEQPTVHDLLRAARKENLHLFLARVTKTWVERDEKHPDIYRPFAEFDLIRVYRGNPESLKWVYSDWDNDSGAVCQFSVQAGYVHLFMVDEDGFGLVYQGNGVADPASSEPYQEWRIKLVEKLDKLGKPRKPNPPVQPTPEAPADRQR